MKTKILRFCKKTIVLLLTLTPETYVYEIDPVISDTSQQEQWSIQPIIPVPLLTWWIM